MIIVDDQQREIAVVRKFGDGYRGTAAGIDHRCGIQRVAIHPHNRLLIQRRGLGNVIELIDPIARVFLEIGESKVGLGGCSFQA